MCKTCFVEGQQVTEYRGKKSSGYQIEWGPARLFLSRKNIGGEAYLQIYIQGEPRLQGQIKVGVLNGIPAYKSWPSGEVHFDLKHAVADFLYYFYTEKKGQVYESYF